MLVNLYKQLSMNANTHHRSRYSSEYKVVKDEDHCDNDKDHD